MNKDSALPPCKRLHTFFIHITNDDTLKSVHHFSLFSSFFVFLLTSQVSYAPYQRTHMASTFSLSQLAITRTKRRYLRSAGTTPPPRYQYPHRLSTHFHRYDVQTHTYVSIYLLLTIAYDGAVPPPTRTLTFSLTPHPNSAPHPAHTHAHPAPPSQDVSVDFSSIGEDMYRKIKYDFSEDVLRLPYIQTS